MSEFLRSRPPAGPDLRPSCGSGEAHGEAMREGVSRPVRSLAEAGGGVAGPTASNRRRRRALSPLPTGSGSRKISLPGNPGGMEASWLTTSRLIRRSLFVFVSIRNFSNELVSCSPRCRDAATLKQELARI